MTAGHKFTNNIISLPLTKKTLKRIKAKYLFMRGLRSYSVENHHRLIPPPFMRVWRKSLLATICQYFFLSHHTMLYTSYLLFSRFFKSLCLCANLLETLEWKIENIILASFFFSRIIHNKFSFMCWGVEFFFCWLENLER